MPDTPASVAAPRWRRRIPLIGGVFIAAIVALAAWETQRSYDATIGEAGRELDAQARVIAEQTARSLQTVDLVERHIAEGWRGGTLTRLSRDELHEHLTQQAVGLVQIEGLAIFDADGNFVASSNALPAGRAVPNVAKVPAFQRLRETRPTAMAVESAGRGLIQPDAWVFPLARRLEAPDGRFAGVIVAGGRVEYFQRFYKDVRLDEGTSITLMTRSGTLVARHPPVEAALGKRFPALDPLLAARAGDAPRLARARSPVDGVDRFGAVEMVADYPLAVIVTRDAATALAPWRNQALGTVLHTVTLGLLAALLLALVRGQFARLDRARASLELSRERFALAAAGSDEGIWDWHLAGDLIYVSARAREIFGVGAGPDSMPRAEWFAQVRLHPDDIEPRRTALNAHIEGRTPVYAGEYRIQHPDGSYRWIRVRGVCVRDPSGQPLRMAGSVTDIDSRRRAEDALRLSEERFALAVAGSKDGIIDWDMVTDRMYSSERMLEMIGAPTTQTVRTRAEWLTLLELHPDDRHRHAADLSGFLAGPDVLREGEYRIRRADGHFGWVRLRNYCVRDASGWPLRLAGSVSDIDAYKKVEAALRVSEERYALAMTGSNEGHWVWDLGAGNVWISATLAEVFALEGGEQVIADSEYFERIPLHPDDRARVHFNRAEHVAGRTPRLDHEFRVLLGSGEQRWIHTRAQCFRAPDGTPLRLAGSTVDITARKRSEEALRESEERYTLAVAGSDDGVWDWNLVTGMAFESARARELQGLPPGPELQPLNTLVDSLRVHPDDAPRRAEGIRAHLAGETPAYECEYRVRHDDGTPGGRYRWIRIRALCIRGADGTPVRIAGSVSDIDARRGAEEALRESEQRFALAVAGTNDGILDWDIVHDRMYVSERALHIVDIDPGTPIRTRADWSERLMPRLHPDDAVRLSRELGAEPDAHPATHDGEYRVRHRDGEYRWTRFRGISVRDTDGRPIRWAGSISDIDAECRTEEALRRSEERYQLAVAGSNEGLWDWDMLNDTMFLSPRAQELLCLEPSEPLRPRRTWIALSHLHPDDVAAVRGALSAHVHGRTNHFRVEYRLRQPSGDWRWYRQRGIAVRDPIGRPTRMAGSIEDITDRKAAEVERERLGTQLRQAQKLEAIGTLAGGIAHDFNNILAAILGYGELAQKDAPEGSALRRHVDAQMSAGMRAKSLVERILAFSRSGMGERVPVRVQAVVAEALDAVAASLPHTVQLERTLAAHEAAVLGDPTQVHQVVLNLCANAVQAMKGSGRLAIGLDCIDIQSRCCATSTLADGRYVRLQVEDSGSGIAPALVERIFDPFFTTKEVGVGTGLGLSLVHGIVTDLGGGIDVESEPGVGSTFSIYLPWRSLETLPDADTADACPAPAGEGQTILLVDDEEALVRLGEETIAGLGYEPVGFTSSLAALAAFRAEPGRFDAVLSDESMPELTGSEMAQQIRALRADIPIVLMSGYVTPAMTQRAREAGVADVLSKPLVAAEIAHCLAQALAAAPASATTAQS